MPIRKPPKHAVPEHQPLGIKSVPADAIVALLKRLGHSRTYAQRVEFEAALAKIIEQAEAFRWTAPSPAQRAKALRSVDRAAHALHNALNALDYVSRNDLDSALTEAWVRRAPAVIHRGMDGQWTVETPAALDDDVRGFADRLANLRARLREKITGLGRPSSKRDELRALTGQAARLLWKSHKSLRAKGWRAFVAEVLKLAGFGTVNPAYSKQFDAMLDQSQ